jgi:hypothetical protein
MMHDMGITLASNDSLSSFPDNTLVSFTNLMPSPVVRRAHKWYVALDTVSFHDVFSNTPAWVGEATDREPHFIAMPLYHGSMLAVKHGEVLAMPPTSPDALVRNIPDRYYTIAQFTSTLNNLFDRHMRGQLLFAHNGGGLLSITVADRDKPLALLVHPRVADWMHLAPPNPRTWALVEGVRYPLYMLGGRVGIGATRIAGKAAVRAATMPKYVRLNMSGLRHTGGSDVCKRTLAIVPYVSGAERDRFFHEVRVREFLELDGDRLESLQLSLVDDSGEPLRVTVGQPTFAKLTLREMDSQSFLMRFSSLDPDASGVNSDFTHRLSAPLHLDARHWQMALSSVQFPSKFLQLTDDELQLPLLHLTLGTGQPQPISLRRSDLVSPSTLVATIQRLATRLSKTGVPTFSIEFGLLKVHFPSPGTVSIVNSLAILLGVTDLESAEPTSIVGGTDSVHLALAPINLHRLTPAAMMLYCDAIDPVIVGSKCVQVLKMIPVDASASMTGRYLSYECKHLDFVDLAESHMPSLHFSLARFDGKLVQFDNAREEVLYNLYFRKKGDQ